MQRWMFLLSIYLSTFYLLNTQFVPQRIKMHKNKWEVIHLLIAFLGPCGSAGVVWAFFRVPGVSPGAHLEASHHIRAAPSWCLLQVVSAPIQTVGKPLRHGATAAPLRALLPTPTATPPHPRQGREGMYQEAAWKGHRDGNIFKLISETQS